MLAHVHWDYGAGCLSRGDAVVEHGQAYLSLVSFPSRGGAERGGGGTSARMSFGSAGVKPDCPVYRILRILYWSPLIGPVNF